MLNINRIKVQGMSKTPQTMSPEVHETDWWRKLYRYPLIDLGDDDDDQQIRGIYSPRYEQKEMNRFMSDYYESIEGALSQAEKIDLTDYYYGLISEALNKVDFPVKSDVQRIILDVGCGFGSTTIPLFKLFHNPYVVASELSLSMLSILRQKLVKENISDRCVLMQLNAEELDFHENSFDLIVGAAILHHLFHPEKVFDRCTKILKKNGYAIFFEPFENGTSIMCLIYKSILNNKRAKKLSRKKRAYFKNCISVWQKMKLMDKTDSFFNGTDDKWLFTKQYFNALAEKYCFEKCIIYPLEKSNRPFEKLAKTHFEGNDIKDLPAWVWDIINEYEGTFSDDLKMDLLTEGCIILKK